AFPTHAQPGGSSATRALPGSSQEAPKALWDLTPKEAFLEAAKQNKLSVLIFLNPGEAGSDQMLKDTLKDEAVLKWLGENSIAITEIAGSDSGWIKRKGIRKFPTVSIRTSNRRIIDIIHGQHSTEEWLTLFDTAKRSSNATTRPEGKAAEDPYSWLAYGSYLFGASGDPNEIGNAFLWCLDNTVKKDTEFYEKHLDFILRKLVQVAKLAPNVKQGIYTRRDALHRNVVAGKATNFE
ncbi:MAG: hypothetical protein P1V35_13520, partial [Planctomycetota bacterium]|nr:hypothetical protein [Planctomycetota bacterium]